MVVKAEIPDPTGINYGFEGTSERMVLQFGPVTPAIIPPLAYERVLQLRDAGILPPEPETVIVNNHFEAALKITSPYGISALVTLLETKPVQTIEGNRLAIEGDRDFPSETLDIYITDTNNGITKRARFYTDNSGHVRSVRLITVDFSNGREGQKPITEESFFRDEWVYVERWDITKETQSSELAERIMNGLSSDSYVAIVHKKVIRGNFGSEFMWDHRPVAVEGVSASDETPSTRYIWGMKPYIAFSLQDVTIRSLSEEATQGNIQEILNYMLEHKLSLSVFFEIFSRKKGISVDTSQEEQTRLELEYRGEEHRQNAYYILKQILEELELYGIEYQPANERKISI